MARLVVGSGLVCSVALMVGLGFVVPVGSTVGGVCDLIGVVSGMVLFGAAESA